MTDEPNPFAPPPRAPGADAYGSPFTTRHRASDVPSEPSFAPYGGQPTTQLQLDTLQLDTLGDPLPEPGMRRGPRTGTLLAGAAVVALVAGGLGGAGGVWWEHRSTSSNVLDSGASLGAPPSGSLSRPPESVAGIAQKVLPSVVLIKVVAGSGGDTGSGFVLRSDGYILTNNHVVAAGVTDGKISVVFANGDSVPAKIVGRSPAYDLAVLKVDRTGLPAVTLGNSDDVVVGDQAIAIGAPLGLAGTVTSGIISARNRPVTTGGLDTGSDPSYISALQTDAAVNPGNSGGPLVDGQGRVIGVNSAIATLSNGTGQSGSIGLGFSIPVNQARRVSEQIVRTGSATYPIVGVQLDKAYQGVGARISQVAADGPSAKAGLKVGDIVRMVDGQAVTRAEELIVAIRAKQPGDVVTLVVERDGREQSPVSVTLGSRTG